MKKNIEILQKVADLVGFKFSSEVVSLKFAEVELDGGLIITNSTEGDFMVGDTISIKNDDGTYTIVGAGEHKLVDGRIFITDAEGKLAEMRDSMMEAPVVETVDAKSEEMESTKIEELKAAIHDVLFAFETQSKSINELRADLESFKKSASHKPLKEDKIVSTNFSDARYEVLRSMKEANKK